MVKDTDDVTVDIPVVELGSRGLDVSSSVVTVGCKQIWTISLNYFLNASNTYNNGDNGY